MDNLESVTHQIDEMSCAVHCVCITTCPLCATQLHRLLSNRTTLNKWMHGKGSMDNTEKCQVARA